MKNRIENLGDYNTMRIMLQERNGDLSILIKEFENIGAYEALPKQLCIGALIGASISVVGKGIIKKASNYIKKRKKEKEDELKGKLKNTLAINDEDSVIEERKDVDYAHQMP